LPAARADLPHFGLPRGLLRRFGAKLHPENSRLPTAVHERRVPLRRDVAVAELCLEVRDRPAVLQEVRAKRVPQRVRRQPLVVVQPRRRLRSFPALADVAIRLVVRRAEVRVVMGFREYMEARKSPVRCQSPSPQHWTNHAIGRSGIHLTSIVSLWNSQTGAKGPEIRAELSMVGPDAKQEFAALEKQKNTIEAALGFPLTWHNPENKHACGLYTRQDADFLNEQLWPQQFDWLRQRLETMHRVFAPMVKNLKTELVEDVEL
jgi:hypothetical protein